MKQNKNNFRANLKSGFAISLATVMSLGASPLQVLAQEETNFYESYARYSYGHTYFGEFENFAPFSYSGTTTLSEFEINAIIENARVLYERQVNLRSIPQEVINNPFTAGNGTATSPFVLTTPQDLINLGLYTSGMRTHDEITTAWFNSATYVQMADIDLDFSLDFVPIGLHQNDGFRGIFIGADNTISNVIIDFDRHIVPFTTSSIEGVGFFSSISNAQLHNIRINGLHLNVLGQSRNNVGGLVGHAIGVDTVISDVQIRNASINAPVANRVGGIVGFAQNINGIRDIIFFDDLNLNAINEVGGIVGFAQNIGEIRDIRFNNLSLHANNEVGGIVGFIQNNTPIVRGYVNGEIVANNNVGGIFGSYNADDTRGIHIHSNYFNGNITGSNNIGGLGGFTFATGLARIISNNYTDGRITGNSNVGGIIGQSIGNQGTSNASHNTAPSIFIRDNYSLAHLSGNTNVGGIVGLANRNISITTNYVYNKISYSNGNIGGLIGQISGSNNAIGTIVQNNLIISTIIAPISSNVGILIGQANGSVNISNNYYGAHSIIMGGANQRFNHAQPAFDLELQSPGWWNNVLLINQNNAFDTSRVQRGLLPFVNRLGENTNVSDQIDTEFVGNQNITVNPISPHPERNETSLQISINADGNTIQTIEFLGIPTAIPNPVRFTDYTPVGQGIILNGSFMSRLPIGEHRAVLVLTGGQRIPIIIRVVENIPPAPEFRFINGNNEFIRGDWVNTVVAYFEESEDSNISYSISSIVDVHGLGVIPSQQVNGRITSISFVGIDIPFGFASDRNYYEFAVNFHDRASGTIRIYIR